MNMKKHYTYLCLYKSKYSNRNKLLCMCWQYSDRLESLRQLEYELEEVRNEVQLKSRQAVDINDNLNVVKVEMASLREQKNNADKEVCTRIYCSWLRDMAML